MRRYFDMLDQAAFLRFGRHLPKPTLLTDNTIMFKMADGLSIIRMTRIDESIIAYRHDVDGGTIMSGHTTTNTVNPELLRAILRS
jgi:hypothetical protein